MAGISISDAAMVVENAFLALGFGNEEVESFNYPDKLAFYCDDAGIKFVKTYLLTDQNGGLPSIGCRLKESFVSDINRDATYGQLIDRIATYSFRLAG